MSFRESSINRGIHIRILTSDAKNNRLPENVLIAFRNLENATKRCTKMQLNVCVSYGARSDIVNASKTLAKRVTQGEISLSEIDEAEFSRALCTKGMQPPDLLIRTSETRLSNFLLWELAFSELHFTTKLWPEIERADLTEALEEYSKRTRRFGR